MNLKRIYSLFIVIFVVLGLQACGSNKDDNITSGVKAKMASDASVANLPVSIATKDGEVTLSGTVENANQAQTLVNLAQSVVGVKKVTSKITIKGVAPQAVMPVTPANQPAAQPVQPAQQPAQQPMQQPAAQPVQPAQPPAAQQPVQQPTQPATQAAPQPQNQ